VGKDLESRLAGGERAPALSVWAGGWAPVSAAQLPGDRCLCWACGPVDQEGAWSVWSCRGSRQCWAVVDRWRAVEDRASSCRGLGAGVEIIDGRWRGVLGEGRHVWRAGVL
jgi:hypothetical protein